MRVYVYAGMRVCVRACVRVHALAITCERMRSNAEENR